MIVYRDLVSGDEVLSDAFKLLDVLDAEGNVVPGLKMVESKLISKNDDVAIGDSEVDPSNTETVNNVVNSFNLTPASVSSATELKGILVDYIKKAVDIQKEKGTPVETLKEYRTVQAPAILKYLVTNFKDLEFYYTESFNPEAMVFSIYLGENLTPNFVYIMLGLKPERF